MQWKKVLPFAIAEANYSIANLSNAGFTPQVS
jgi:hypothetical protein